MEQPFTHCLKQSFKMFGLFQESLSETIPAIVLYEL